MKGDLNCFLFDGWSIASKRERQNVKNESAKKERGGEGEGVRGKGLPEDYKGFFFHQFLIDLKILRNDKMLFWRFSFDART